MPIPDPQEPDARRPARVPRRSIARGAAWAAPTMLMGISAPAIAASPVPCPAMPSGNTAWTTTSTSPSSGGRADWTGTSFTLYRDSTDGNQQTVTTSSVVQVTAGVTYGMEFVLQAGMGYRGSGTCDTLPSTVVAEVIQGQTTTELTRAVTRGSGPIVMNPPQSCTVDGARVSRMGYNNQAGASLTVPASFVATASGPVTLRLRFLQTGGSTALANDDWLVTPRFTTCRR